MRNILILAVAVVGSVACTGASETDQATSAPLASASVYCSGSLGPVSADADAGDVIQCPPGAQCAQGKGLSLAGVQSSRAWNCVGEGNTADLGYLGPDASN